MDQLKVHKAKNVKPIYAAFAITPVYNVGYTPEFNPIESVFSQVKRVFCRERLNKLVNNEEFDTNKTIRSAFSKVTKATIVSCIRKSLNMIRDLQ